MARDAIYELLAFAEDLRWEQTPPDVRSFVLDHVTDALGVLVAGSADESVRSVAAEVAGWGSAPRARVPSLELSAAPPDAALVTAMMMRALDFDDVHESAFMHPCAGVIPVAIALAQQRDRVSGAQFLSAITAGLEWCVRLGLSPTAPPNVSGMSHTFQAGILGGTLTAGLLLGLRGDRLHDACGIAYGLAGGNQQALAEGSMSIRLQQGMTAMNAVIATSCAKRGVSGPREILEGRFGLFNAFYDGGYDRGVLVDGLGTRFQFIGTSIKPYPACKPAHPAIAAALALRRESGLSPDQLRRVTLGVNDFALQIAGTPLAQKQTPGTVAEMQFSLPWAFATAFVSGQAGLAQFSPGCLADERVVRLARLVEVELDADIQRRFGTEMAPVRARIETSAGHSFERTVERVPGHPTMPMDRDALREKFIGCFEHAGKTAATADDRYRATRNLSSCDDVGAWLRTW